MTLKNRKQLAELFRDEGFKRIAEIGTFDGHYAEVLCQTIPDIELLCVDPWAIYPGYRDHKFESSMRRAESKARERLAPYKVSIDKRLSADAVKDVEDGYFDAVFIDANHEYSHVKDDIEWWAPKVRAGGIVSGHDYYKTLTNNVGVIKAVHEYTDKHGYDLQVTLWDLDSPVTDDRQPCWWFVV